MNAAQALAAIVTGVFDSELVAFAIVAAVITVIPGACRRFCLGLSAIFLASAALFYLTLLSPSCPVTTCSAARRGGAWRA
jgi:hypothetical protein